MRKRPNAGVLAIIAGTAAVSLGRGVGTTLWFAVLVTLAVLVFADLRTPRGRAIAAETIWVSLFAINIGHDSQSTLYLTLDLLELASGTALIAWLLWRSERRSGTVVT